jgi:glycosyltransferase involved in cell wall biosynthesis
MLKPANYLSCDFTLALNNATGKYFFCRDMIRASRDLIVDTYYWRFAFAEKPTNLLARILGRLALLEVRLREKLPISYRIVPAISRRQPVIFTDARECLLYRLKPSDVVLCHDLGPIIHSDLYAPGVSEQYVLAFERIVAARPLMLFVSNASRRDFIRLYGNAFPLMGVVHPPIRVEMSGGNEQPISGIPSKFLLTVGSIGSRKNQWRAIKAFAASGLTDEGYAYVICGGPEPGADAVVALAHDTPSIVLPGYVNDSQLRWLYTHAQGFVLPSLLEGFGLPAAEAVSHGLIPLVGPDGALHEVTGDAAVLVDPLNIADIAAGMRKLASMSAEERKLRLVELRVSIARFTEESAIAAWRSALIQAAASSAPDV